MALGHPQKQGLALGFKIAEAKSRPFSNCILRGIVVIPIKELWLNLELIDAKAVSCTSLVA